MEILDQTYPLSIPQTDVYYEQLLYPGSSIYNIGAKVEVRGCLDPIIFRQAALLLVKQHDSLRSQFFVQNGEPRMRVLPDAEPDVGYVDLSGSSDPLAEACEFIQEEFQKPFDIFGRQLLNSYHLVKVSADLFYIVGKYHHLIVDGWSTSLLFTRLGNNYSCVRQGLDPNEGGSFPYSDFIEDDRTYQVSDDYRADELYWKEKFRLVEQVDLSSRGKGIKPLPGSRRKEIWLSIAFSAAHSITVFHFLLAVTYLYLSAVFSETKLIFGLPLLNRKTKKFKNTIGMFAGVTPLIMDTGPDRLFTEVLTAIRNELRDNFRHQRLPLSAIAANAARINKDERRTLHQVFFSYEKHDYSVQFDGHPATVIPLTHQLERAPLAIYVREFDDARDVKIDFEYNLSCFEASFIETFTRRFGSLTWTCAIRPVGSQRSISEGMESVSARPAALQSIMVLRFG